MYIRSFVKGVLCLTVIVNACNQPASTVEERSPLTAEQLRDPAFATRGLKVKEGLEVTLFASEPMVINPTNIDVDEKGRVWVTQAYNYRYDLNPGHPVDQQGDRIVILEDNNGDGRADTAKVFYQDPSVNAALGIAVLGNKVIVSCSPNVFILTDENGDDKADRKDTLFRGFGGFQHDHAIHAFTFGPDGKLYFNFGNFGDSILDKSGQIVKDQYGNPANNHGKPHRQGMAFRCNPDGSKLEVLGHNFRNPYEIAPDAFGGIWQSDNDDDGNRGTRITYLMEYGNYGYTDEMTGASWQAPRVNREDSIPLRHWHLNDPGVVPNLLQTGSGSPAGLMIYDGDLLPPVFRRQMIHAEPGHNIVRAYPVTPQAAGYTATIEPLVEGDQDKWFRPVDVCAAPDGSLFIADWYDPGVGGHRVGDLEKGRIFRVAPHGTSYKIVPPELTTVNGAVKALTSPNVSTRYLGWTALHKFGEAAEKDMVQVYRQASGATERARALWLLSKLPGTGLSHLNHALEDKDERIRITAIRAARQLNADLLPMAERLANDTSAQVRREAAIALRLITNPGKRAIWARLASQYDGQDRWYLEALGIGSALDEAGCFDAWLQSINGRWNTAAGRDIVWRSRAAAALPLIAEIIEDPAGDPVKNLRFFRALDFHTDSLRERTIREMLHKSHPQQNLINAYLFMQTSKQFLRQLPDGPQLLQKSLKAVEGQAMFADLVQRYELKDQQNALLQLALQHPENSVKNSAVKSLLAFNGQGAILDAVKKDTGAAMLLIKAAGSTDNPRHITLLTTIIRNTTLPAPVRMAAATGLSRSSNGYDQLWKFAGSTRSIQTGLDTTVKNLLLSSWKPDIKNKAQTFYKTGTATGKAVLDISELEKLKGNIANGQKVYKTYCAVCHVAGNMGVNFGPGLSEIGSKLTKGALYDAIIHPDAGISFGFEGVRLKLKNGNELLGYISSETENEIEIKMPGGSSQRYKRTDIASRKPYDHSLMPTGLAEGMPRQDLVDLVEFLAGLKK